MNHAEKNVLAGFFAIVATAVAPTAMSATVIETESLWDGEARVFAWGSITSVYGQTLVAPGGAGTLTGFSFRLQDTRGSIPFTAHVYRWTGSQITGDALFSLSGQNFGGGGTTDFLKVQVATNAAVTPGDAYVMFLSTIGQSPTSFTPWGLTRVDAYAPGRFVFQNTDSFATLSTDAWGDLVANGGFDLAFTATFDEATVVPIPGALGLMLSGALLLGMGALRQRRN